MQNDKCFQGHELFSLRVLCVLSQLISEHKSYIIYFIMIDYSSVWDKITLQIYHICFSIIMKKIIRIIEKFSNLSCLLHHFMKSNNVYEKL